MKVLISITAVIIITCYITGANLIPNPDFENWTNEYICESWSGDSSSSFYISRESSTVFSGNYAVKANILTQNQSATDLISDTFAVVPGDTYDFSFRFFDNDAAANGRYYFYYFDASKNYLSNYYGSYTTDDPAWQVISGQEVPGTGVYYMLVGFRFYDVSTSWDGDAYIYADSAYFGNESGTGGNIAPSVSSLSHIPSTVTVSDSVTVKATIIDESGISADTCFYAVGTAGSYSFIQKDSVSGNDYYYSIGNFSLNDTVYYYAKAVDDSSALTISDTNSFIVYDEITGINLNGYTIYQYDSYQSYTFGDITLPDNGYLILSRNTDKLAFESYFGISLGGDVTFINSGGTLPQINGAETYSLHATGGALVDTTTSVLSSGNSCQRDSTNVNTWTQIAWASATPGSGANGGHNAGIIINEYSDAGDYNYEFIELYYDGSGSINWLPQFSGHIRTPAYPQQSETVIISIDITDDTGIAADTLFYSVNYGANNSIMKDSLSASTYYYTIPGYNENDIIEYYIKAVDDSSASAFSNTFDYTVGITSAPGMKVLFDYTKEETAGNADWIIDTDYPHPSPANPSSESDWLGGISYWGFELDSFGYECWTLPPGYSITYDQSSTDSLDLSYFDVFIIPEPQNPFTASEKKAIFDFVRNGGGLFMVADHVSSDRNGNGWDSPMIFDDLPSDSFGIHFQQVGEGDNNLSSTSSSFIGIDTIYNGPFGDANNDPADATFYYHAGTTNPANSDPDVIEIAPVDGDASRSMLTAAYWGEGKVIGMGDSSPADDGTGQLGNTLYDGWTEGAARYLILNATYWLSYGNIGNTAIEEIFISCSLQNDNISVNIASTLNNLSMYRLYVKERGGDRYRYMQSIKYNDKASFIVEDTFPYGAYFKVTGITGKGDEIYLGTAKYMPKPSVRLSGNIVTGNAISLTGHDDVMFCIYDHTGRVMLSGSSANSKIDISSLNSGIYLIKLNENNERLIIIR